MVRDNLASVRERIRRAAERAKRDPEAIRLVVVTKEADLDQIREAIEAGVNDVGENRLKSALAKQAVFDGSASLTIDPERSRRVDSHVLTWHMIGHLQSKKAREAVKLFSLIHSVDSIKLACIINSEARKIGKTQDVLAEVNVSGEKSKFGIKPNALSNFIEEAKALKHINVRGLMTMAPFVENPEIARPIFRKLKELADTHGLKELSMGMTQDFEVAVEEGATMVRVGSAIFKE